MSLELDPDRRLALAYVPAARRAAVEALWRLDATLGSVLATGREPMVSRIRLAWWREALEQLDRGPPPPEPVLEGLARHVVAAGITGAVLASMEEGWAALLEEAPLGEAALRTYAERRGRQLFALSARLLGEPASAPGGGGEAWALADLARRSSDPREARSAAVLASRAGLPARWPTALRPLGMLAVVAMGDARRHPRHGRPGSPARILRMLVHRLNGR